jgi:hypothetical protein
MKKHKSKKLIKKHSLLTRKINTKKQHRIKHIILKHKINTVSFEKACKKLAFELSRVFVPELQKCVNALNNTINKINTKIKAC